MNSKLNKHSEENNKIKSNSIQKEFPLPPLQTTFRIFYNPLHDSLSDKIRQWEDWMKEISGIPNDIYDKSLRCTTQYAPYFFPFLTDMERYESVVKFLLLAFVWDDHTEPRDLELCYQIWGQFHDCLDKLLNKKFIPTDNWKPYTFASYAVLERFVKDYNMERKKHFLESWRMYAIGNCKETEVICGKSSVNNMDEWWKIRKISLGAGLTFQIILYAYEIILTDEEWKHPNIQELMELVSIVWVLTNDFFSFEKEFSEQGGNIERMFNVVTFISIWDGIDLTESLVKVAQMVRENEMKIKCLEEKMLNDPNMSEMQKLFINRLIDTIGANYASLTTCKRYLDF